MNNPDLPFLGIVADTIPYLWGRTAAGVLMTVGHSCLRAGWCSRCCSGGETAQGAALASGNDETREVEA